MFWWKERFVSSNMTFQGMCLWLIKQWPCWTWKEMIKSKTFLLVYLVYHYGDLSEMLTQMHIWVEKNSIWLFVVNIHIFKFIFSAHSSSPLLSYFITERRKKNENQTKLMIWNNIRSLFKWKWYCSGEL